MRGTARSASLALGILVALATCAHAQVSDKALNVLRQSILAQGTVSFSGLKTVVIFRGGEKVRGYQEQVYEKAPGKRRWAVIAPEDQRGRLCIRNGQVQWEYSPKHASVVRRELPTAEDLCAQRLTDLDRLRTRTRIQYLGTETIANRPAHIILVSTRQGVPVKKTWIDTEHYVPLKTQQFDCKGLIKSSAYYEAINYQPQYADGMFDFTPPAGCTVQNAPPPPRRMKLPAAEKVVGFRALIPRYLPPGYRLQTSQVAVTRQGGQVILWLPFSNGVDTFSIFQRPLGAPPPAGRAGRSLSWHVGDFSFTLVGGLPQDEMKQVRDSVKF